MDIIIICEVTPSKGCGIIGIAAAPDFTTQYALNNLSADKRRELKTTGKLSFHSEYFEEPLVITKKLIDDGNENLVLTNKQSIDCPVRLLHGSLDEDVPISKSIRILEILNSSDIQLQIIKGIDHRFSTPECLNLIKEAVEQMPLA